MRFEYYLRLTNATKGTLVPIFIGAKNYDV